MRRFFYPTIGIRMFRSGKRSRAATQPRSSDKSLLSRIAILGLGIIFPAFTLLQAYAGLSNLREKVMAESDNVKLVQIYQEFKKNARSADDFRMFALLFTENANQKTMINKQVMKVSIMQIGFSVMSLGLMFVVLGINDGGANATGSFMGVQIDIKKASTGVLVFLIGAGMATAGGVLKNDYSTVKIPMFGDDVAGKVIERDRRTVAAFNACKEQGGNAEKCFYQIFELINKGDEK